MQYALKFEENLLSEEVLRWKHSASDKGQIYTRPEVVEYMLTAVGLGCIDNIDNIRILEPSCGEGEFVVAIARRLIDSPKKKPTINQLLGKILAIDIVDTSIQEAKRKLGLLLIENGYSANEIEKLYSDWFKSTDFLLEDINPDFTHVIGNPPYVRVENVPKGLLEEYRRMFSTMTDRADLYIPFYEKSLSLLVEGGRLSFICTDRWTKNTYGKSLRNLVSDSFSLELYIDLYGVEAFEKNVMTYPAITQIKKAKCRDTLLLHGTTFSNKEAKNIFSAISGEPTNYQKRKDIVNGVKPWLLGSSEQIAIIKKLENSYPTLEESGCKVCIGVATGANKIYIVDENSMDVEPSRLIPVITASELKAGRLEWQGKYLINTYDDQGVISLDDYPKLASYLNSYKAKLSKRHVAKKDESKWFKTIDRVHEGRAKTEKLLIPDISNDPIVIYDEGTYQPNNSIYYILADEWNLNALRTVLLSNVTRIFISTYSTKIAKEYLRYQAQYLRKLRLPAWDDISEDLKERMTMAGMNNDVSVFTALTCEMYRLNAMEQEIVGE